jgi:hypothetical protein
LGVSKRLSSIAAVVGFFFSPLLLGGCPSRGAHSLAAPKRAITQSDIIGAWRYAGVPEEEGDSGWIVTIEFASDGTFRQTLVPPRARNLMVQMGAWRVDGKALKMEPLIVWDEAAAWHWARREQTWPVMESAKHSGALAICGGLAADHSLDRELDKISDAECRLLTSIRPPPEPNPGDRSAR